MFHASYLERITKNDPFFLFSKYILEIDSIYTMLNSVWLKSIIYNKCPPKTQRNTTEHRLHWSDNMKKITLKIACYEIEDITLKHSSDNQLAYIHIPCDYDTEFCMQLDGWDENTSIPAQLKDKNILLYRHAYDKENHHWILKVA